VSKSIVLFSLGQKRLESTEISYQIPAHWLCRVASQHQANYDIMDQFLSISNDDELRICQFFTWQIRI